MSTLFADAMRSMVFSHASGFYETLEMRNAREARERQYAIQHAGHCHDEMGSEGEFLCCLSKGHRGSHKYQDGEIAVQWRPITSR